PRLYDRAAPPALADAARSAVGVRAQRRAAIGNRPRTMPDIPYRFDRTDEAAGLRTRFAELGAGEETGVTVSVAGRLMLTRPQGKLTFAELRDWSCAIQLFAGSGFTPCYD